MPQNSEHKKPTIKIIVATHRKFRMPEDPVYMPLQVGAVGREDIGYQRDDTGENISGLNPYFCELTGLYWAWKNLDTDYVGLAHYRRHFSMRSFTEIGMNAVLSYEDISPYLGKVRLFIPKKRRYFIETLYSHYKHTHYIDQLDKTRAIISEKYPGYLSGFDRVIRRSWGYMFNMMIMDRALLSDYCSWVFDILFELRKRIGEKEEQRLSPYQRRLYGRISEIIFNVWLDKKIREGTLRSEEIKEIPVIEIGRVNWINKCRAFLMAKFLGKKYESSF